MLTVEIIKGIVAKEFGVNVTDINSRRRAAECSHPRFAVMLLAKEKLPYSLPQIARCLFMYDHSSVIHGIKRAKELENTYIPFREAIAKARAALNESEDYKAAEEFDRVDEARVLHQATFIAASVTKRLSMMARENPDLFLEKIAKVLS